MEIQKRVDWQHMPDSTRVWIYQSNRELSRSEIEEIAKASDAFVDQWTSHGATMEAVFEIFHNRFLVLFADESKAKASGCGIDKSVHFVQGLEQHFDLNFFDRMTICFLEGEQVKECKLPEIPGNIEEGVMNSETLFFDNLVPDKGALLKRWKTSMGEGWTSRFF